MSDTCYLWLRGFYFGGHKMLRIRSSNIWKVTKPYLMKLERRSNMQSRRRCFCLASIVDADAIVTSEWVPTIDQMLLMTSIVLTYIAGVIPSGKNSSLDTGGKIQSGDVDPNMMTSLGR